jgi:nucleotide-binding universal stress UspA family protein
VCEQEGCDAIFIGARDTEGSESGGVGRVAQAVAGRSPVPVTVVRPPLGPEAEDEGVGDHDAG